MAISAYQGSANELVNVFQFASQMPSLLRGYQFSHIEKSSVAIADKKVDIWQSGNNIRVKSIWLFPEGTEVAPMLEPIEYAFNGTHYQWFVTGMKTLTFSRQCRHPTPYWGQNPLMAPYYWLVTGQANWSDIKDLARWEARFIEAKYVGQKIENGTLFEVVSFPVPQMDRGIVHVYFAKEINYYPIKMRGYKDGLQIFSAEVTQYKTFDIDGMPFVFPLKVEMQDWGASGEDSISVSWTIDESSIKINPQLDEDLFTISPLRATTVIDFDRMLEDGTLLPSFDVADDGSIIVHEHLEGRTWNTQKILTFVIVNLVIIAFMIYLLLRWRK